MKLKGASSCWVVGRAVRFAASDSKVVANRDERILNETNVVSVSDVVEDGQATMK